MKYRESEIFNSYAKLAIEQGLVSDEITKEAKDNSKYDSLSNIELLYGIKQEPDDKKSIIEVAHPETAVITPSYDAMNSIVENVHQRQDIMMYIALKNPDGILGYNRYVKASQELKDALISIGFAMDNAKQTELMSFADSCTERLVKKSVFPFLAIGLRVAAIAAMTYYFSRADVDVQNINANSDVLLNELSDVEDQPYAAEIKKKTNEIKRASSGYLTLMQQIASFGNELVQASRANDMNKVQEINAKAQPLVDKIEKVSEILRSLSVELLEMKSTVKSLQGEGDSHSDWYRKLLNLKDMVFGNDTDDILNAMTGLSKAINQSVTRSANIVEEFKKKYAASIAKKIEKSEAVKEQIPDNYLDQDTKTQQVQQPQVQQPQVQQPQIEPPQIEPIKALTL